MILASTIVTIGIITGVIALVVWLVVFVSILRDRSAKTPVPANLKPYYEDDVLETTRLERVLQGAVILLLITGITLGAYFVYEPNRQASAFDKLEEKSVERGAIIFGPDKNAEGHPIPGAFACQNCHGPGGTGGSASYNIKKVDAEGKPLKGADDKPVIEKVTWAAPSLNEVLLRYSEDEVRTVIVYGRPGTPMPAWGVEAGGPMNKQQIQDAIDYLKSIQLSSKESKKKNAEFGLNGRALFDQFCARCHTIGYSYGQPEAPGNGGFGPSLRGGSTLQQFPNEADHIEFVTTGDEWQKPYGVRGVGQGRMPGFGQMLSQDQITAIVRFERSLLGGDEPNRPEELSGNP